MSRKKVCSEEWAPLVKLQKTRKTKDPDCTIPVPNAPVRAVKVADPVPTTSVPAVKVADPVPTTLVPTAVAAQLCRLFDGSAASSCVLVSTDSPELTAVLSECVEALGASLQVFHPWSSESAAGFEQVVSMASRGSLGSRGSSRILFVDCGELWAVRHNGRKGSFFTMQDSLPARTHVVMQVSSNYHNYPILRELRKVWKFVEIPLPQPVTNVYSTKDAARKCLDLVVGMADIGTMAENDRSLGLVVWTNLPKTYKQSTLNSLEHLAVDRDLWSEVDMTPGGISAPTTLLSCIAHRRLHTSDLSKCSFVVFPKNSFSNPKSVSQSKASSLGFSM